MANEQILTDVRGRVGIITLNRPDRLNALTPTMNRELHDQVRAWNEDNGIGAIVLTGAGRGFCSGADIAAFEQRIMGGTGGERESAATWSWPEFIVGSKPTICAINGVAVGEGMTMTLPCDIRLAAPEARLSFRFVRLGLTPELGSSHYLPRLIGLQRSLELLLSGRFFTGAEAVGFGLALEAPSPERLVDRAVELGQEVAEGPLWQSRVTKELVHAHALESDFARVLERERKVFREAQSTPEHREAMVAFREKRAPRFH